MDSAIKEAIESSTEEMKKLLTFSAELLERHRSDVFAEPTSGYLRLVAAAALMRIPDALRGIMVLCANGLPLEANTVSRTLLELAIVALWIGLDERRARQIWNRSRCDWHNGLGRASEQRDHPPVVKEHMEAIKPAPGDALRPNLKAGADQAIDVHELKARQYARYLYNVLYDPLSAAAHGDLRFAKVIANEDQLPLIPSALSHAVSVTIYLLAVVSAQLGFQDEYAQFLAGR